VELPVTIIATVAWVKANALSSSPSESSRAGSRERFTRTISDVEPLMKMASWGVSVFAFAQNCVTVLGRSVAFSLWEFDFYLFKLWTDLLSWRFDSIAEGSQQCYLDS
jgi:hypothetical protein